MMKKVLALFLIGVLLQGCETTNTSGGNINITGETARIPNVSTSYVKYNNCKYIKSTKHTNAGWTTFQADVNQNIIKIANEVVSLNATHFVLTGSFNDGLLADLRTKVSSTADIYDCKQKEKIEIAEKSKPKEEKPKKVKPKEGPDENEIVPAGSGSGFLISKDGELITNFHVIDSCDANKVHFKGRKLNADILAVDKINDLALIKINQKLENFMTISNQDVSLLEEVVVAGFPLGKDISSSIKTHKGVVTSLSGAGDNFSNFQTDATINQGNSGGPIINQNGNVVGVAVATWIEEGVQGIHFGIKSSTLRTFIESNNLSLPQQKNKLLTNKELGKIISNATVYLECHMTIAKIKKMIAQTENRKAFFKEHK